MTAILNEQSQKIAPDVVIYPINIDADTSIFRADKKEIGFDGKKATLLSVILHDACGNAILNYKSDVS
ncbi:MAG: hypothetical protein ACSLEL_04020 [Candidatus Malihini olakiniferum]